jgi:hypothetical protein
MRTERRRCAALVLAFGLSACASGPSPSEVSERRNAASSYVLTQKVFALSLAKQCRFDPDTKVDLSSRAQAALEGWERRNRARVDAASRYFEDYLSVVARREGLRKGEERRGKLTAQYTASGARAAQSTIEQEGGRARCPDLLEALAGGDFDIASMEFDATLDELVARYGAPAK